MVLIEFHLNMHPQTRFVSTFTKLLHNIRFFESNFDKNIALLSGGTYFWGTYCQGWTCIQKVSTTNLPKGVDNEPSKGGAPSPLIVRAKNFFRPQGPFLYKLIQNIKIRILENMVKNGFGMFWSNF